MTRNPTAAPGVPDTDGPDGGSSAAEGTPEDRSPKAVERAAERLPERAPERAPERTSEPGFFEQFVQLLKPRAPAPLRQRLVEALEKVDDAEGGFSPGEQRMLTNLLGMNELRVEDAMVPRSEIEGIEMSATLGEALRRFEETGHSRMPVYDEGLDDLKGMIHIRDALGHITRAAMSGIGDGEVPQALSGVDLTPTIGSLGLVRNVLFVPPSMPAAELMARMQATRIQIALVIDEYGGTDGLVSLEDLIEIIVGDIEDEHDTDDLHVVEVDDGVFQLDARAELEEVRAKVGDDFVIAAFEDEADTIGGLVVTALGRIPVEGETVEAVPGFRLEVTEADARRVKRVLLTRTGADTIALALPH